MKKRIFRTVLVLAVVAAVLLLSGSLYTVNQKQYAAAVRQDCTCREDTRTEDEASFHTKRAAGERRNDTV